MKLAVDYVGYLREQKHYEKGVEVGEQIYDILKADKSRSKQSYVGILNALGILYVEANRHKGALRICRKLSKGDESYTERIRKISKQLPAISKK